MVIVTLLGIETHGSRTTEVNRDIVNDIKGSIASEKTEGE